MVEVSFRCEAHKTNRGWSIPRLNRVFAHYGSYLSMVARGQEELRVRGETHRQALRQLANRLVGILHICLVREVPNDEMIAWPDDFELAA